MTDINMDKQHINHITDSLYRKLKKYSTKVTAGFDPESIHQFRVAYKKLRAFLRMLSQQPVTGEIKISKKLKKGYTTSGLIRDLQLQQQRILETAKQELKRSLGYRHLLRKEIDKLKLEFFEIFLQKPVSESKKKTDAAVPDQFSLSSFKSFVQQKWNLIYSIIRSNHFSDDTIHALRKSLKDMFYNLKIYEGLEHDILAVSIWKGKDEQYFNQLLEELGCFQNKCTSIALIKSYWLNSLNAHNRELLEQLKKIWIKEKVIMKQLLIKKLKTDISPR